MGKTELHNIKDVVDYHIFKYGRGSGFTYKELYQIGYLGYLKAINNLKPEFGGITLSYASKYIRQEIAMTIKREQKEANNRGYLAPPPWNPEADPIQFIPDTSTRHPADTPALEKVTDLLQFLKKEEAYIIREYYLADRPKKLKDLAEVMGVKKQRVHEIKEVALEKLRKLAIKHRLSWEI